MASPKPLEAAAQAAIVDLATLHRWKFAHFHDSRRQVRPGVFVGDKAAAGFPDLVLARDRIVYAELKRQGEKPRTEQVEWLDGITAAGGEAYLWTLDDLDEIARVLAAPWYYAPRFLSLAPMGRRWTPASLWIPGKGRYDEQAAA